MVAGFQVVGRIFGLQHGQVVPGLGADDGGFGTRCRRRSARFTLRAPATTCRLVRMVPSSTMTTPVPRLRSIARCSASSSPLSLSSISPITHHRGRHASSGLGGGEGSGSPSSEWRTARGMSSCVSTRPRAAARQAPASAGGQPVRPGPPVKAVARRPGVRAVVRRRQAAVAAAVDIGSGTAPGAAAAGEVRPAGLCGRAAGRTANKASLGHASAGRVCPGRWIDGTTLRAGCRGCERGGHWPHHRAMDRFALPPRRAEFDADRAAVVARRPGCRRGMLVMPAVRRALRARARAGMRPPARLTRWASTRCTSTVPPTTTSTACATPGRGARRPAAGGRGEIGIDHFVPGLDRDRMQHFYRAQLKLARDAGLPVILHVRRSADELLAGCAAIAVSGGTLHASTAARVQAVFVARGLRLGFRRRWPSNARCAAVRLPADPPGAGDRRARHPAALVVPHVRRNARPATSATTSRVELPRIAATLAARPTRLATRQPSPPPTFDVLPLRGTGAGQLAKRRYWRPGAGDGVAPRAAGAGQFSAWSPAQRYGHPSNHFWPAAGCPAGGSR